MSKDSKSQSPTVLSDSSITTTPFSLVDYDERMYNEQFDNLSTSEGIDVVGAAPTPETFCERSSLTSGRIVRSRIFKRGVLVTILINSILMGLATFNFVREDERLSSTMDSLIDGFRIAFTVEIFLDICHYQNQAVHMGWIVFDVAIVGMSWGISRSILVMRSFRLLRALRKASGIAELNTLVEALLRVLPKMMAVIFLICLVFYAFAVIFTDLYQDLYDMNEISYNYFGRLDRSIFTLFQIMTLDGWADIATEIMKVHPWSCALFVIFIIITSFFFGSLVVAVMGEAFTAVLNERIFKALEADHVADVHKSVTRQDFSRLELRVSELSTSVERMVQAQKSIQESLKQLAAAHNNNNNSNKE